MAVPKTVPWDRDPHTGAKHDLIRRYLQAWTPIMLNTSKSASYVEGFAGPGVYTKGEPGSPVIAAEVFLRVLQSQPDRTLHMVLVDQWAKCISSLRQRLQLVRDDWQSKPETLARLPVDIHQGVCAYTLPALLARPKICRYPIFALLDSWGGPVVPFDLVRQIGLCPRSEVLVTFGPFLTRYGQVAQHRESGNRMFGSTGWQAVSSQPPDRKVAFLVDEYRSALRRAGFQHTLSFEMVDEGGRPLHLVFGTNGPKGIQKMKDAMWNVDPVHGIRYRDQRDPQQCLLDLGWEPDTRSLRSLLLGRLGTFDQARCTVQELKDYTLLETVYRPEQVIATVKELRSRGQVTTEAGPVYNRHWVRAVTDPGRLFDLD